MPVVRTLNAVQYRFNPTAGNLVSKQKISSTGKVEHETVASHIVKVAEGEEVIDLAKCNVIYPSDAKTRKTFKTHKGKVPTAHQYAVYDFVRNIPVGKVTTYKNICNVLGEGSPRSVGSALRNNPFAPFVPCHRIIASNNFIGGFYGEWNKGGGSGKWGEQTQKKIEMLAREGVAFDEKGYLIGGEENIWRGPDSS
ncbi:hypothetical protein M422DRAFT_77208 [Sphaerobolus stellatus SS14]|uniref:Methylated-DNA--protein-cysteine methyltransferase n=1 Tax=Sphaerobolus stellatus (strain SS14) TaxID=990650 RepID=A0A0C9UFA6_SPHS4|nr:hypothetical protein M422DRAFT_77208 [Sphaerobolus stellatus SS14]